MKYVLFLASIILLSACDNNPNCPEGSHLAITISNHSSKRIYYDLPWTYPDTTIRAYNVVGSNLVLAPNDSFTRQLGAGDRNIVGSSILRKRRKNLFIFLMPILSKKQTGKMLEKPIWDY